MDHFYSQLKPISLFCTRSHPFCQRSDIISLWQPSPVFPTNAVITFSTMFPDSQTKITSFISKKKKKKKQANKKANLTAVLYLFSLL